VAEATPGPWGGPATPNGTNPFRFFFFFLVAFGVAGPPPKGQGVASATPYRRMGWPKPPLGQKGGGPAPPFLGKGVAPATPDFPFFFLFFFLKKKKKKSEMGQNYAILGKTASF
jgi:hypothetical protein